MNVVWPVIALFGTVIALWAHFRYGRLATHAQAREAKRRGDELPSEKQTPFPVMVGKGAAHCGSGCCLGDICTEWLAFAVPGIAVALGWGSLFGEKIFAVWILDYIFAFMLGIVFQYFTIKPMRDLSVGDGIKQALKADTLSLSAWQVGMYAYMAFAQFFIFRAVLHTRLEVNSAEFWFMMQIAMLAGFVTSYPVNWWLLQKGIKEKM
jgi:branched-subunit amino acid transport protein